MRGPLNSFPMRDPLDFASTRLQKANLEPTIAITNQLIGVGDGVTRSFQLVKKYERGGEEYVRPVYLPIEDSVIVGINAVPADDSGSVDGPYSWDVVREGGQVILDHAPPIGAVVTAGFLFDVQVRFMADDSFDRIVSAFQVDGFADLDFVEVRPCGYEGISS
jgi:uncharacterized protein (TIGR02217 family)